MKLSSKIIMNVIVFTTMGLCLILGIGMLIYSFSQDKRSTEELIADLRVVF